MGNILLKENTEQNMWKQQVQSYLYGPMFLFQCQIRMFGKMKFVLSTRIATSCPSSFFFSFFFFYFYTSLTSLDFVIYFSDNDLWSFWNEVCSSGAFPTPLYISVLSVSLCRCLGFSVLLWEYWELCPSYLLHLKAGFKDHTFNTPRSLPGNVDEFWWFLWISA